MNIRDKSRNSKLAPVGMAAALFSPKGKPAITLAVPSVHLSVPSLPSHHCPCAPHSWSRCVQGYCYIMCSLKKKSSSLFFLLLRYLKPEVWVFSRWITKRRGGAGKKGRKKHGLLCAWLWSTWVGTAHGRRLSQPSVSQGNAFTSPQMRSIAFGDPTVKDSACHRYYNCSRSTSDWPCMGRRRAGGTALVSRANSSMDVSPA